MRYTINIDIENDAFQPDWQDEVNRILLSVVDMIEGDTPAGDLRDGNGNIVGSCGLRADNEKQAELLECLEAVTQSAIVPDYLRLQARELIIKTKGE